MMLLKIAWRNLFLHKKKSLSALLAIVMAFVALSLFEGYIHDVKQLYEVTFAQRQMLGTLLIEKRDISHPGKSGLDEGSLGPEEQAWVDAYLDKERVGPSQTVDNRVRFLNVNGFITSGKPNDVFIGLAFDPAEGAVMRQPIFSWNTFAGETLERSSPNGILLGRGLAEILACKSLESPSNGALGYEPKIRPFHCENPSIQLQVTTEKGQSNSMDFDVAGLITTGFAEIDTYVVMLPLLTAQELFDTKLVSYYSVRLKPGIDAKRWLREFQAAAVASQMPVEAKLWREHQTFGELYRRSLDFLEIFRLMVISIIVTVVIMAILNNFVRIVHERLPEIGTLRSIGYQPRHILAIFCWEAAFLSLVGSVCGLLASYLAAAFCNRLGLIYDAGFLTEGVPFRVILQESDFTWISCFVMAMTLFATILAAWRASHLKLAEIVPKG